MAVIRTFHPRRGRLSSRHHDALARLLPGYGVLVADGPAAPLDPVALFGRPLPLVLEIGSGMGEATLAMAAADESRGYLAVEIHTPGVGNLLAGVEELGLGNVRVAVGDALDLLRHQVPAGTLDAVHAFFPDPWPKARHHKRRIVNPETAARLAEVIRPGGELRLATDDQDYARWMLATLLASRLRPGGVLWCATDWAGYAEAMLAALTADPLLINRHDGYAPRPPQRPVTKFERRGVDAGRPVFDLVFERR